MCFPAAVVAIIAPGGLQGVLHPVLNTPGPLLTDWHRLYGVAALILGAQLRDMLICRISALPVLLVIVPILVCIQAALLYNPYVHYVYLIGSGGRCFSLLRVGLWFWPAVAQLIVIGTH